MSYIFPWGVVGLGVLWLWLLLRHSHKRRVHLTSYIIYLLMSDDIRTDHQRKFHNFLKESPASNAAALTDSAHSAIHAMADGFATTGYSTLAGHALLWDFKKKTLAD